MGVPLSRLLATALVGVVLTTLSTACAGTNESDSDGQSTERPSPGHSTFTLQPEPLTPGLRLSFIQQRIHEGSNHAQLRVVNHTDKPLVVRRIGLDWPGYPGGLHRSDETVQAQSTLDLHYWLTRPDCDVNATATPPVGIIVTDRGRFRRTMTPDGVRFLHRIWQAECNRVLFVRTATIQLSEDWRPTSKGDEPAIRGALVLTRRTGADPVVVEQVRGSVLFDLSLEGVAELPAGVRRAELPLVVDPGRCDEHARSGSTQTFLWTVWLRVADGDQLALHLTPSTAQQVRLLEFLDDACG